MSVTGSDLFKAVFQDYSQLPRGGQQEIVVGTGDSAYRLGVLNAAFSVQQPSVKRQLGGGRTLIGCSPESAVLNISAICGPKLIDFLTAYCRVANLTADDNWITLKAVTDIRATAGEATSTQQKILQSITAMLRYCRVESYSLTQTESGILVAVNVTIRGQHVKLPDSF